MWPSPRAPLPPAICATRSLRLTEVARRRVCITLATGSSPRVDERILAAVGLPAVLGRDYLYAFNILAAEGIRAEVRYIDSTRDDTFASPEDAYEKLAAMIDDSSAVRASDTERQRARANLREWLTANLVPNESAGAPDRKGIPQLAWRLAEPRTVTWAFLAWNAR